MQNTLQIPVRIHYCEEE